MLATVKQSDLLRKLVNYDRKKFYYISPDVLTRATITNFTNIAQSLINILQDVITTVVYGLLYLALYLMIIELDV
jgi:hypothetical protein